MTIRAPKDGEPTIIRPVLRTNPAVAMSLACSQRRSRHVETNKSGGIAWHACSHAESIASMERVRQLIAAYKAKFFINHDKSQTDKLKLLPAFYD
jgi:hypothetical protein